MVNSIGLIFTADFPDTQFYGTEFAGGRGEGGKKKLMKSPGEIAGETIRFRISRSVCGLSGLIDDFLCVYSDDFIRGKFGA